MSKTLPPLPEVIREHLSYFTNDAQCELTQAIEAYARAAIEAQGVPDVDDLRDCLVAISSAVAHSDDREAQAIIRTTLEALASAPPAPQQKPLLDEKKIEMWTNATIECCTHMACYMRGIEDAEAAHNIKD